MKFAIIEDERYTAEGLRKMICSLMPGAEPVFMVRSVTDAVSELEKEPEIDILFADIELEDGNCFEIFERIVPDCCIVFTTAYDEYALKAFEVHGFDYLLKPVTEEMLGRTLEAYERSRSKPALSSKRMRPDVMASFPVKRTRILVRKGAGWSHAPLSEVAYFYSEDKYIMVRMASGCDRMTEFKNLDEVAATVDPVDFFRVSRSMLVRISSVIKVTKHFNGRLKMYVATGQGNAETTVIISAARRKNVLGWLGGSDGF